MQRSGAVCVSSFCIPCPPPSRHHWTPKSQVLRLFHISEGGQLDSMASQVAVGRGYAVCSPQSSAHCEIHISWRCPRCLFPSVLVLAGEKGSELERPVGWGWGDRKDPLQRHAQPAPGTAALEAPRFPAVLQSPVL
ncbi:mCG1050907 [Mus musculus]|jgi:hypothetical protein|nr:mCG1050907 [Mus musculus]